MNTLAKILISTKTYVNEVFEVEVAQWMAIEKTAHVGNVGDRLSPRDNSKRHVGLGKPKARDLADARRGRLVIAAPNAIV